MYERLQASIYDFTIRVQWQNSDLRCPPKARNVLVRDLSDWWNICVIIEYTYDRLNITKESEELARSLSVNLQVWSVDIILTKCRSLTHLLTPLDTTVTVATLELLWTSQLLLVLFRWPHCTNTTGYFILIYSTRILGALQFSCQHNEATSTINLLSLLLDMRCVCTGDVCRFISVVY